MSSSDALGNSVKARRLERKWSQADLAVRAGISRAAVSAIESQRLTPSVAAALALARVFGCTVEDLFGQSASTTAPSWAWPPPDEPWRYWEANVNGRVLMYPVENTGVANGPHDGVGTRAEILPIASQTLVMASCDPAAGLLTSEYQRRTGLRLIAFTRSSQAALELFKQGLVHVAGVHFATREQQSGNTRLVRETLGPGFSLVRAAGWDAGIAVSGKVQARSVEGVLRARLRWVGREPGSGARKCLDQLLPRGRRFAQVASDHRGVAEVIRGGGADAGVCVRLVSDEARLQFLTIQQEACDLCFATSAESDPRIEALVSVLQSASYRRVIGELTGYDVKDVGSVRGVD